MGDFEVQVTQIFNNLFIQTADAITISMHETLLGIVPAPEDTLEFRRWRVLNRYRRSPPYTIVNLKEFLNEIVGIGLWELEIDYENYKLNVVIINGSYGIVDEVYNMLYEIVPAHIEITLELRVIPEPEATIFVGGHLDTAGTINLSD